MTLQHPAVFAFLCVALVVLSVAKARRATSALFLILNVGFITLMFQTVSGVIVLSGSLMVNYLVLRVMPRMASRPHRLVLHWMWLLATLAGFFVAKRYLWLTDIFLPIATFPHIESLGFSFLLFRQIHLSIDVRDGVAPRVRLLDYLNYNLAFWTFLAGPIQRFVPFCEQIQNMTASEPVPAREILLGLNRAMLGFTQMFVVGWFLNRHVGSQHCFEAPTLPGLCVLVVAFPAHLYVNFSGYCDIGIGLSRAVGFRLPENFNHPYLARSCVEFWGRWHITLSEFFRDYIYYPLHTGMSRRIAPLLSTILATLCSFTIMGAWHGSSVRFVTFGVIHAVGVISAIVYQHTLKRFFSKAQRRAYNQNRVVAIGATALCQTYILLSFLPFQYESAELHKITRDVLNLMGGLV